MRFDIVKIEASVRSTPGCLQGGFKDPGMRLQGADLVAEDQAVEASEKVVTVPYVIQVPGIRIGDQDQARPFVEGFQQGSHSRIFPEYVTPEMLKFDPGKRKSQTIPKFLIKFHSAEKTRFETFVDSLLKHDPVDVLFPPGSCFPCQTAAESHVVETGKHISQVEQIRFCLSGFFRFFPLPVPHCASVQEPRHENESNQRFQSKVEETVTVKT